MMVEEIEFDTEMRCEHVFQKSCFESYTTSFKNSKVGEGEEKEREMKHVPTRHMVWETCSLAAS